MSWMKSIFKSLPFISGGDIVIPGELVPGEPDGPKPVECNDEICVVIETDEDGQVFLNNLLPTDCMYEILVNPTTKHLLVLDNETWQLQNIRGEILADSADLIGSYSIINRDIKMFRVSSCEE